jgi:hypothetical protein
MDKKKALDGDAPELEAASGGVDVVIGDGNDTCHFVHVSGSAPVTRRGDGAYEAECGGNCNGCLCHGKNDRCVLRKHIVTQNGSPLPNDTPGHKYWYK